MNVIYKHSSEPLLYHMYPKYIAFDPDTFFF